MSTDDPTVDLASVVLGAPGGAKKDLPEKTDPKE